MRRPRWDLYELGFLVLSVLLGFGYLTTVPAPSTVAALMPGWLVALWAWVLLGSGALGIVGCLWRGGPLVGLGMERAALAAQSGALLLIAGCTMQAWAIGALDPFPALGIGFTAMWMTMNVLRIRQIAAEVRMLTREP